MAEAARARKFTGRRKVHTWPHLVRGEFLVAIVCDRGTDFVVDYDRCAVGRAGESHPHSQSVQGAVVFSRFAGNAGLFRSLERRCSSTQPDHCWADGDPVHRHQSQRQRLLLFQRPKVRNIDFLSGISCSLGEHDHHRDLFPRTGMEPILALAALGSPQSRGVDQR